MIRMLRLLLALSLTLTASSTLAANTGVCASFTDSMMSKVMAVFHNTGMKEAEKRKELSVLFQSGVDIDWIAKYVLGHYWNSATPQQQQEYLTLYRSYLTNNYISKFKDEDGLAVSDIKVTAFTEAEGGNEFETRTIIKHDNEPDIAVDYRLAANGNRCTVHDIKVEGVSLLISQRSEFSAVAGNGGVPAVIAALQSKAAH